MIEAAEPLSNGVQVGLRIPVILIGLAGVVLMLIFMKRLGVVAALLGALGSFLIAVDQIINIVWVVHTTSLATSEDFDAEHFNSVTNIYTFTDVALITIGTALVVLAIVVRRPASSVPAQPGYPGQPAGQVQPGQFLQPGQFAPMGQPGQFGQQPYQDQPGQFGQQPYQEQPQSAPPANYPQPPANYPQQQPYQAPPQPYQPYQPPSQPAYPPEEQPDSAPPTQPFYQQQPYQGQPQPAPPPNYQQPPYPGQQ